MNNSKDRRVKAQNLATDRRKGQERRKNKVEIGAQVRRQDDWDKIDQVLKED